MEQNRRIYRDMGDGSKDLSSPWNEGFSFTQHEYDLLRSARPQLFDPDPQVRLANWKIWSTTIEGQFFRVR